ncbi:SPOR domain-containing protein [Stutzerimonas tarimensis]|uniref:SPOR domain-containing protein n=1 Tax=Stutzerimonas tarimensis TaxID=1507735 RepID=A0ABV7T4L1_9GAMM
MIASSAPDTYLDSYGFTHDPFAARVPGFKFFPAQRKPVLGQLHHLARYSQLLLVVTGPEGSGKSLLRQALAASSNKQSVQCMVVTPGLGESDSIAQLARALGASGTSREAIMAQVGQATLNGLEIYLLVDDAERVDEVTLQLLLDMAAGGPEGRAHVFLFGTEALVSTLEASAADSEAFHVIELQPYSLGETHAYLMQRIEGAGGDTECLDDEQVKYIHQQSGGWPGSINRVAREVLIEAVGEESVGPVRPGSSFSLPWKHLAVAGVVLVGVVMAFVLQRPGDGALQPQTTTLALEPLPVEARVQSSAPLVGEEGPVEPGPVMREPLASVAGAERGGQPLAPAGLPAPVEVPSIPVAQSPSVPAVAADVAAGSAAAPQPQPQPQPQPTPARTPEVAAAPAAPATPAVAGAGAWYLAQPSNNYVLQVLGTRSEQTAQSIARQHGSSYRYFVKTHEGKPLYVVTYGSFATQQAARAAVKSLPGSLQGGSPWARSLASVQQEIKEGR